MNLSFGNKIYDVLKFIALVLLPAAGSLYFALSGIWNLPASDQVVGTLTVIDTFLGGVLGLSSKGYTAPTDGKVVVDNSHPEVMGLQLQFHTPQEEMAQKDVVHLKVEQAPLPSPPIPGPHGGGM